MRQEPLRLFLDKIERRHPLPGRERAAILELDGERRDFPPGATVIAAGDAATHCVLLGSGLMSRRKTLPDGKRQVLAVHLAGDAIDLQSILFREVDHDIQTHSAAQTLWVPHGQILDLCDALPLVAKAMWLDTLVDSSIFREWTANIGQRGARERIAHFFAEMAARHEAVGLLHQDVFELALNQQDLANALGLSLVHTNKSLRSLREANLLLIEGRTVRIVDRAGLEELAAFSPLYLHLDGARAKDPRAWQTDGIADVASPGNGLDRPLPNPKDDPKTHVT